MMLLFSSNFLSVPPGTTIDFWEYHRYWWSHTGILIIFIAVIGVGLIVVGIWFIRRTKRGLEA